jgi:divalent metal cation (Fe/Co/Zn/Cd) transporter
MAILTDQSRSSVERRASRISAALLFVLAAYVVVNAAYGLWRREGQEFSMPGLVLTILVIPVMWWLARAKMRVAHQIVNRQRSGTPPRIGLNSLIH